MPFSVDNAIIMAAGLSTRFVPLSLEQPKSLLPVKGEILIERQIRQLLAAGVPKIYVVTGYMRERFLYLEKKYGVSLLYNPDYAVSNNISTLYTARAFLRNTYICSSDNYFTENPFHSEETCSCYTAEYAENFTDEWCLTYNRQDTITDVTIGGFQQWYMVGYAFWSSSFSDTFQTILEAEYSRPDTRSKFWEDLYIQHIKELPMKIRRLPKGSVYEFDSLDELRSFDPSYRVTSGSAILTRLSKELSCPEAALTDFVPIKNAAGRITAFSFRNGHKLYRYDFEAQNFTQTGKEEPPDLLG